jgi:hypothetical protein
VSAETKKAPEAVVIPPGSSALHAFFGALAKVDDGLLAVELERGALLLATEAADRAIDFMLKIIELREH